MLDLEGGIEIYAKFLCKLQFAGHFWKNRKLQDKSYFYGFYDFLKFHLKFNLTFIVNN